MEALKKRKVFTVYGQGSNAVRTALIGRGWVEKIPMNRKCSCELRKRFDKLLLSDFLKAYNANFIWGDNRPNKPPQPNKPNNPTKKVEENTDFHIQEIANRCESPIRNKLKVTKHWSNKHGISSSLKNSFWYYIDNVAEVIAPRTFSNANVYEKIEFINDYQLTACTSLLRWITISLQNNKPIFHESGGISIKVIVFAIKQCKYYFFMKQHKDIDGELGRVVTGEQWNTFLKKYQSLIDGKDVFQIARDRIIYNLINYIKYLLVHIRKYRPQIKCEGCYNIWIIKPSGYSRGRGIEISSNLDHIVDIITKSDKRYVVQKYIGNKNLFNLFKFVIISS